MTFQNLATRVFSLYRERDFEAALEVVEEARTSHPEEDNTITFWEACLLAQSGQRDEVVETLLAGIDRGEWWPTGKLADTDLDPIRELPGWEAVRAHCATMTEARLNERPAPIMRHGTGGGTLVTIQGAHAVQEQLASTWQAVTPGDWTVITPAASEPTADGGWEWAHSMEANARRITDDLQEFDLTRPIILTGFSIGSAIACHLINSTYLQTDGLIAIAPSSASDFEELLDATASVRSLVICGDEDSRADRYRELASQLSQRELVSFDMIEGLGHANPADFDHRLDKFLQNF